MFSRPDTSAMPFRMSMPKSNQDCNLGYITHWVAIRIRIWTACVNICTATAHYYMLTKSSRGSTNPASYPVLHRNYRRLQYKYWGAIIVCSTNIEELSSFAVRITHHLSSDNSCGGGLGTRLAPTSISSTAFSMAAMCGSSSVRLPHSTGSIPNDGSCFNHSFSEDSVSGLMRKDQHEQSKSSWSNTVWLASSSQNFHFCCQLF